MHLVIFLKGGCLRRGVRPPTSAHGDRQPSRCKHVRIVRFVVPPRHPEGLDDARAFVVGQHARLSSPARGEVLVRAPTTIAEKGHPNHVVWAVAKPPVVRLEFVPPECVLDQLDRLDTWWVYAVVVSTQARTPRVVVQTELGEDALPRSVFVGVRLVDATRGRHGQRSAGARAQTECPMGQVEREHMLEQVAVQVADGHALVTMWGVLVESFVPCVAAVRARRVPLLPLFFDKPACSRCFRLFQPRLVVHHLGTS